MIRISHFISGGIILISGFILSATAVESPDRNCSMNKDIVRFGIFADAQYADIPDKGKRQYRESLWKIDSCIAEFNESDLDFAVNLGDLVDRCPESLDTVNAHLSKAGMPLYHVLGNHDVSTMPPAMFLKKLRQKDRYYSFTAGNWGFIVLDTNEKPRGKADRELARKRYAGVAGPRQVRWLEKTLDNLEKSGLNVIIFSHQPIFPSTGINAVNDIQLLELFRSRPCIKAVFAGHHHRGGFGHDGSVPYIVHTGMVESGDDNSYSIVTLADDRIIIEGFGTAMSATAATNGERE